MTTTIIQNKVKVGDLIYWSKDDVPGVIYRIIKKHKTCVIAEAIMNVFTGETYEKNAWKRRPDYWYIHKIELLDMLKSNVAFESLISSESAKMMSYKETIKENTEDGENEEEKENL